MNRQILPIIPFQCFKGGTSCVKQLVFKIKQFKRTSLKTSSPVVCLQKVHVSELMKVRVITITSLLYSKEACDIFTSMFVQRMQILEYRQKFEVELSTFPGSINTKTRRKLAFSLTRAARARECMCACMSFCLCGTFISGYLPSKSTDLDENIYVCCNWPRIENLPWRVQSNHYFPKIWGGIERNSDFRNSLNPNLSKNNDDIKKKITLLSKER